MLRYLFSFHHWANRHSRKLLVIGLLGVVAYNWHQWKKDQRFSNREANLDELPSISTWFNRPKVSVLVAAWDEAAHIEQHIHSFLSLRYPHKELVICAGGSDGSYKIAQRNSTDEVIVLLQKSGQGKQGALSRCFSECTGEIIYLTDADCILDDESLERVIYPITCGEEIACSGGSLPFEDSMGYPLVALQAASDFFLITNPEGPQYYPGMFGRNCALSRGAIHSAGDFNTSAPTGTDFVLAMQLNKNNIRIKQVRNSLIRSEYSQYPLNYMAQKRRWHRNVMFYSIKFRNLREFGRSISLSLIALSMLLIPIFSLQLGLIFLILWIILLLNGFLSRIRYLRVLDESIRMAGSVSPLNILCSLFLDFIAWSLAFIDLFIPSSRHRRIQ
jgi:cellulose synthase/poly-beta-1,6-N-acetylglucosamine synthase-like glycosyltransferase